MTEYTWIIPLALAVVCFIEYWSCRSFAYWERLDGVSSALWRIHALKARRLAVLFGVMTVLFWIVGHE